MISKLPKLLSRTLFDSTYWGNWASFYSPITFDCDYFSPFCPLLFNFNMYHSRGEHFCEDLVWAKVFAFLLFDVIICIFLIFVSASILILTTIMSKTYARNILLKLTLSNMWPFLLYRLLLRSVSTLCHNVPSFQFSKVLFYQFFVDFSHPLTTCSLGCYLLSRFPEIWSKLPCHTSIHAFEIYPEKQMRESCTACHTKKLTLFCKYLVEYNSQVRMFALMWILLYYVLVRF